MDFQPPGSAERYQAVGATAGLPETLRLALDPGSDFEPIPAPKPGDWLVVLHTANSLRVEHIRTVTCSTVHITVFSHSKTFELLPKAIVEVYRGSL